MNQPSFEQICRIYEHAAELDPEARAVYLEAECGGDDAVRGQVEQMLSASDSPLFLERPDDLDLDAPPRALQDQQIGPFRVLGVLGEGGFGTVYRAEQDQPVRRPVALKVLHPRRIDSRSRLRFEAERQTVARLQHAGIAQVYDAGETSDGLSYFAMELVEGLPITKWCDRQRLGVSARLELFQRVCAAVQHAHQRGVVHRDLKPSNVLVKDEDGTGIPKVIDFGVAKLLLEEPGETITLEGSLVGTPGYMSPEQASGRGIDTRTDVYSLGVLLFDLLAGDLPFAREQLSTGNVAEIIRVVCEEEPRRLSTVLSQGRDPGTVAERRGCSVDSLTRTLRGDLEWVARKALSKDPERRYATVAALSEDIDRYLRQSPVTAREPAALYVLRKFIARHRLGVSVAVTAATLIVFGIALLLWGLSQVDDARQLAVDRGADADRQRDAAVLSEYAAQLAAARAALEIGDAARALRHLRAAAPQHRGWEWRHLLAQCDGSLQKIETGAPIRSLMWLDEDRVLTLQPGSATIHNVRTGVNTSHDFYSQYDSGCFNASRARVVVDVSSRIEVWDLPSEPAEEWNIASRLVYEPKNDVRGLTLSADGSRLATSENGGDVRLFDLDGDGAPRLLCNSGTYAWKLLFCAEGSRLLLALPEGRVEIRNVANGELERELTLSVDDVKAMALSPDERILYAGTGNTIQAVDLESSEILGRCPAGVEVHILRLTPDGRTLYGAGGWIDGRLTAWDAQTLEVVSRFHGHRRGIRALDPHPSKPLLASGGEEGALCVWPAASQPAVREIHVGRDARLAVAYDGEAFVTACRTDRVSIWSARTLDEEIRVDTEMMNMGCALGAAEAFVSGDRLLAVDRETGAMRAGESPGQYSNRLAIDPQERWLVGVSRRHARVSPDYQNLVYVWKLPELSLLHRLELTVALHATYDARTGTFVLASDQGQLLFLDPERGEVVSEAVMPEMVHAVAIGAGQFAVSTETGTLHLLDPSGQHIVSSSSASSVGSLAISPDGERIAAGGTDTLLTLWNLQDTEMLALDDAPKPLSAVHFVAGGERILGLSYLPGSPTYVLAWDSPPDVSLDQEERP